jgi:hypothetical protein
MCCGIGGAFTLVVRLLTRIDERAQLDWSGSLHGNRGLLQVRTGGNPIELHLLRVPKAKYRGVAPKRGAPGAAVTGEGKLGIKKVGKIAGLSKFKRSARRRGVLGPLMRNSSLLQFDRATLRTAWKYVYLFPAYRRLTRYVE